MDDTKIGTGVIAVRESDVLGSVVNEHESLEVRGSQPRPRWRRFAGLFWDSLDGEPRERRYVQKLDAYLL